MLPRPAAHKLFPSRRNTLQSPLLFGEKDSVFPTILRYVHHSLSSFPFFYLSFFFLSTLVPSLHCFFLPIFSFFVFHFLFLSLFPSFPPLFCYPYYPSILSPSFILNHFSFFLLFIPYLSSFFRPVLLWGTLFYSLLSFSFPPSLLSITDMVSAQHTS